MASATTRSRICRSRSRGAVRRARAQPGRIRTADHGRSSCAAAARRASAKTSSTTPSTTSASRAPGRRTGLPATRTFAEFSRQLDGIDLFPAGAPERDDISRDYRRWAFESAALDLALRQAGTDLAAALGREPRPVNFVSSMRLAGSPTRRASSIEPLRRGSRPTRRCASSSTRSTTGTTGSSRRWSATGRRRLARPQGLLQRHAGRRRDRPRALREADRGLPGRLARGSRRDRRDAAAARSGPRAGHLGRADPLDRRHRGDALVAAADGQRQALALRPDLATSSPPTTTARSAGSAPTAAARPSSGRAAARSSTWPRSSTPTRPNDVAPSGYNEPEQATSRGCRRARSSRRSSPGLPLERPQTLEPSGPPNRD